MCLNHGLSINIDKGNGYAKGLLKFMDEDVRKSDDEGHQLRKAMRHKGIAGMGVLKLAKLESHQAINWTCLPLPLN